MSKGSIYLLQEREFINSEKNIYKIGKTKNVKSRMYGYPKGSEIKILHECDDCDKSEKDLIKLFDEKFTQRKG